MQPLARISNLPPVRKRAIHGAVPAHETAILSLIAANAIWGTSFVVTKPLLMAIPPVTLAMVRLACAVAFLLTVLLVTGRRPVFNRETALLGFVGIFLVYIFQNVALQFTTAANSTLAQAGVPVFTTLLAAPMLGEHGGPGGSCRLLISAGGVAAIVLGGAHAMIGRSTLGDALILLSVLCLASRFTLGGRMFSTGPALEQVTGMAAFGLLFLLPASLTEVSVKGIGRPPAIDLAGVAYLGLIASGLAFVFWAHGLRHLPASQAATFANLNPLVGMTLAVVALGEAVTAAQLLGGVLILGGVWLAARQPARHPVRATSPDALEPAR